MLGAFKKNRLSMLFQYSHAQLTTEIDAFHFPSGFFLYISSSIYDFPPGFISCLWSIFINHLCYISKAKQVKEGEV